VEKVDAPGGVRREIHDLVLILLHESERRGYINLHDGWCWGGACRPIKTSSGTLTQTPSNHSWGLALDLNAPENVFGGSTHKIPTAMARLWNEYGFRWGGDYSGTKDWMHFEFMGTPDDARAMTEKAKRELGGDELTNEEQQILKEAKEFLDTLRGRLKPGPDKATPTGAAERTAAAVKWTEDQAQTP
jgi:hypothetical protein